MESDPSSRKRVVAMGFFVMAGIAMLLLQWLIAVNNTVDTIPFSQFEQLVAQGSVTEVSVTQDTIQGTSLAAPRRPFRLFVRLRSHWRLDVDRQVARQGLCRDGRQGHLRRRRRRRRGQGRVARDRGFLKDPKSYGRLGALCPRVSSWSARRAQARPCWPAPSPAKRTSLSSRSTARNSSRCSSASAPHGCAICSSRRERRPLHHLHRRTRRARAKARAKRLRRLRRKGADTQPASGRNGRIRSQRGRDHAGGDQPARDPRPGAAAGRRFDRQVLVDRPDKIGALAILRCTSARSRSAAMSISTRSRH